VPLLPPLLFNNNGPFSTYIQGAPLKIHSRAISDNLTYIGDKLNIKAILSTNHTYISDKITLKLIIEGDGNVDFFVNPFNNLKISNLFISEPKSSLSVGIDNSSNSSVKSIYMEKIFEYDIIPHKEGKYQLPSINLKYLNKNSTSQKVSTKALFFNVSNTNISAINHTKFSPLPDTNKRIIYHSGLRYSISLVILGIMIMIGASFYTHRNYKLANDHNFARSSHAKKRLSKIMTNSEKAFKNNQFKETAQLLRQSILYFCTDKFSLNLSLSPQEIIQFFKDQDIDFQEENNFLNLLSTLEFYAFAITPTKNQITSHIEEAYRILGQIDKLKLSK